MELGEQGATIDYTIADIVYLSSFLTWIRDVKVKRLYNIDKGLNAHGELRQGLYMIMA